MKVLLIDGNSIVNRAFYGIRPLTSPQGLPTNAVYGFLSMVGKIKKEIQPDAVAVAFDMHQPTFRHDMYDEYKGTRQKSPDGLHEQIEMTQKLLIDCGVKVITCPKYEADDILGTLAQRCKEAGHTCYLYTGDKDAFQLIDDNVFLLLPKTMPGGSQTLVYDKKRIAEEFSGLQPHQMIDVKALAGDTSDNIPGVRGIGAKTAVNLIEKYGSIENIYDCLDALPEKAGTVTKLRDGRDSAFQSKVLGTICCDAPIAEGPNDLIPADYDRDVVLADLQFLGFSKIIKDWGLDENEIIPE